MKNKIIFDVSDDSSKNIPTTSFYRVADYENVFTYSAGKNDKQTQP